MMKKRKGFFGSAPVLFSLYCMAVFLWPLNAGAQTINQLVKAGDKKFDEGDYYAAALYYKDAVAKDEQNAEVNYKFAEASRMFNDYANAALGYKAAAENDAAAHYPLAPFWLGEMLKSTCTCKYDEAIKQFKKFRNKYHKKDYYAAKATQEIEACSWAKDHTRANDSIKIEHLGKEVNSEQSEFNAIHVFPDRIQFSSLRNISTDKKNEQYLVRIYNQQPNPEKIFMPQGADPSLNIGNGTYSPDSKRFYFTQCEQKDKSTTRCDIYVTRYENYKWTAAEKLPKEVNDAAATNTHPTLAFNQAGNQALIFASDRPGGEGQLDIWVSAINKDGTFAPAINAGKLINTQGNEVTPFFDINSGKLYFSSDWHYGFGGYDIFSTEGEGGNWSTPKNLLQPVNTPQNDLYYSLAIDNSRAFITSNRIGSYFIEAETCCNDIYAYQTGKKTERLVKDTLVTATPPNDSLITGSLPPIRDTVAVVTLPPAHEELTGIPPAGPAKKFIAPGPKNIKQFLPVTLYFHNDQPDCCNLRDTTALDYKQAYEAYTVLLNEYRKKFAAGLQKDAARSADAEVFNLFTQKVDKGYYDLVAFTSQLLDLLQGGNRLEITIKGFCSPLNDNNYNIHLGNRRTASLRNYFYHYREGILLPYISNGALVFKNESVGEETAPATVSDKLEDTRNSVYNPAAAFERKVEIISVEIK